MTPRRRDEIEAAARAAHRAKDVLSLLVAATPAPPGSPAAEDQAVTLALAQAEVEESKQVLRRLLKSSPFDE